MTNGFFTEAEARTKQCSNSERRKFDVANCSGSDCMAWRWKTQPVLKTTTYIGMELYLKHPEAFGVEDQAAELKASEKAWEALPLGADGTTGERNRVRDARLAIAQAMKDNPPDVCQFVEPKGDGWETDHDMAFDADMARWGLLWVRDTDPDATGYCGACPVKPEDGPKIRLL